MLYCSDVYKRQSGNFVMIRKNKSLGQWYGYKIDGVYASQHEINEQEMCIRDSYYFIKIIVHTA